jgi:hypothetical protein
MSNDQFSIFKGEREPALIGLNWIYEEDGISLESGVDSRESKRQGELSNIELGKSNDEVV